MNLLIAVLPGNSLLHHLSEQQTKLENAPNILHLPLQQYQSISSSENISQALDHLPEYRNIVFSDLFATRYFLELISPTDLLQKMQNCVYFARNKKVYNLLNSRGIPAIRPQKNEKAIDVVEYMLQFKRFGATLYPCRKNSSDEIPGFLEELGIPVNELAVYKTKRLSPEVIASYTQAIEEDPPDAVLFHSIRSVNTLPSVFSMISMSDVKKIALNTHIAQKMEQQNIPADLILHQKKELLPQLM